MSPLPTPINCEHPRLVRLIKFKGEHVIYYRCEQCGTHLSFRIRSWNTDPAHCVFRLMRTSEFRLPRHPLGRSVLASLLWQHSMTRSRFRLSILAEELARFFSFAKRFLSNLVDPGWSGYTWTSTSLLAVPRGNEKSALMLYPPHQVTRRRLPTVQLTTAPGFVGFLGPSTI
jgi:hypothetical protein